MPGDRAGAGSDILERFSFEACLIDEATQATEPATIVPLTKGCRQVVLIGDQKQLPPTIISREADAAGLGTSLFERMLQRGIRAFMLKVQYRMHPAIAAFPSKAFYKGELLSGTPPSWLPFKVFPFKGFPFKGFFPLMGFGFSENRFPMWRHVRIMLAVMGIG